MTILPFSRPRHRTPRPAPDGHVHVALTDGGTASLRPLGHGETEPLHEVFAQMSAASRYSRYLAGTPRLPAAMAAALTDVDGRRHAAWLATVDGAPAGIARYVAVEPGTVEVAFEVVDAQHGRGLGSVLLDTVTTIAAARGFCRVQATVMPANQPSLRLLRRLGLDLRSVDGLLEGTGPLRLLDPARVDRAAVVSLALRTADPGDGAAGAGQEGPWTSDLASAH
jgi:RimJ/RimL family protein N-acetyltransferase